MHLESPVDTLIRLRPDIRAGLAKLGIKTIRDLLYHFPTRYADASTFVSIANLTHGMQATVRATIKKIETKKSWRSRTPMSEATIVDVSGTMRVVWFNQPYLARMLTVGNTIEVTGKVALRNGKAFLTNPSIREEKILPIDSHDSLFANTETPLTPIYAETKGVSSEWFRHTIERALAALSDLPDHIPAEILQAYSLPSLRTAFIWIHIPKRLADATAAKKRFAFDEIFLINIATTLDRLAIEALLAYRVDTAGIDIGQLTKSFSFALTGGQKRAITTILHDLERTVPMSRLLEGDVGSGKTAVAAVAAYATVMNRPLDASGKAQSFGNLQVAYMAPTEILAMQHFESFIELFRGTGIALALITGSGARKFPSKINTTQWTDISRAQLKKWIANGEISIVIGTHTLIQKSLEFKHLALAIIDEQHRFGLKQRKGLAKKDVHFPHLLSMTATPIPRTLALTLYGDLDVSILDELPQGRGSVVTELVLPTDRSRIYERIRASLQQGRQAYIICPRIDEGVNEMKNVVAEAARLKKEIFPEYRIGILHGKLTKEKKEAAMSAFAGHEIDILVATSVVEVGINVPNATTIIIEGAERFGLAQLHQLRGRVQRSTYEAHCYLFADTKSEKTLERMKLFVSAKNGFELAEYDLHLRGAGELSGASQWGVSDIGMEALRNPKLVVAARESARALVESDPTLSHNASLALRVKDYRALHLE